jgi:hypothetical protein
VRSRKAMMVAGMRPGMPLPSMLRIVTSFLVVDRVEVIFYRFDQI